MYKHFQESTDIMIYKIELTSSMNWSIWTNLFPYVRKPLAETQLKSNFVPKRAATI